MFNPPVVEKLEPFERPELLFGGSSGIGQSQRKAVSCPCGPSRNAVLPGLAARYRGSFVNAAELELSQLILLSPPSLTTPSEGAHFMNPHSVGEKGEVEGV